ncbi:hypothetical protein, partial [uncultured Victivallis sp.]|uniref:hypothetical protein n=1 Tax=uncultured Victivallis sp. TaxID=354118 RepID=UPI0025DB5073
PVSGCRQYRLEGVVHTTGLAGGFDFDLPMTFGIPVSSEFGNFFRKIFLSVYKISEICLHCL